MANCPERKRLRAFRLSVCGAGCATALLAATGIHADDDARIDLTVTGIDRIEGAIGIAVFGSAESFERRQDPVAQGFVTVTGDSVAWSTMLAVPGSYAVIVYQDLNDNRVIDMSRIGRPTEPYGFSNNPRSVFGPPDFDDARIELVDEVYRLSIELR